MGFSPGDKLGHIRLESLLGKGGMGQVWKGFDTQLHRHVAVKILPPEVAGDATRNLFFLREAQAAAALNHPNIAAIHDVGESNGVAYFVMEYLQGESLRTIYKKQGKLPVDVWLRYMVDVARGLQAAHQKKLVHRDFKPDNVMTTANGTVKILDFGIAKHVEALALGPDGAPAVPSERAAPLAGLTDEENDGDTPSFSDAELAAPAPVDLEQDALLGFQSRFGSIIGTFDYMSPEQTQTNRVDHRTDIFSFGIVAYEGLAGQNPFRKKTVGETATAIRSLAPTPLNVVRADVTAGIAQVVERCLARDPSQRFQSADDLVAALERCSRHQDSLPQRWKRAWALASRAQRAAALLSLVALGAFALTTGIHWAQARARQQRLAALVDRHNVAVATFEGKEVDAESIIPGLQQDWQQQLRRVSGLTVFPASPTGGAARGPHAGLRLSGTLAAGAPGTTALTIKLQGSESGEVFWQRRIDYTPEAVLRARTEVLHDIVTVLGISGTNISLAKLDAPVVTSPRAYWLILKAADKKGLVAAENKEAVALLQEALSLDPDSAMGHARLSDLLRRRSTFDSPTFLDDAVREGQRAVELENGFAPAHASLGRALAVRGGIRAGKQSFLRALELDRNDAATLSSLATSLVDGAGEYDEALGYARRAYALDPLNARSAVGNSLILQRNDAATRAFLERELQRDPRDWYMNQLRSMLAFYEGQPDLAWKYLEINEGIGKTSTTDILRGELSYLYETPDALDVVRKMAKESPGFSSDVWLLYHSWDIRLAALLVRRGFQEEGLDLARKHMEEANAKLAQEPESLRANLSVGGAYALLGDNKAAVRSLRRAKSVGFFDYGGMWADPLYTALQRDPAFVELIDDMKQDVAIIRNNSQKLGLFDFGPAQ